MVIPLVDLRKQYESIREEKDQAIHDVIQDTAFIGGKYVKDFEFSFGGFCRAKYCVGVGNGTDSLYIALRALEVGPGDDVIISPAGSCGTAKERMDGEDSNVDECKDWFFCTKKLDKDEVLGKVLKK